jgi:hypothetical protein
MPSSGTGIGTAAIDSLPREFGCRSGVGTATAKVAMAPAFGVSSTRRRKVAEPCPAPPPAGLAAGALVGSGSVFKLDEIMAQKGQGPTGASPTGSGLTSVTDKGCGWPNTAANPLSSGTPGCPKAGPVGATRAAASCTNPVSVHMFLRLLPLLSPCHRWELPILYPPGGSLRKIQPIGRLP